MIRFFTFAAVVLLAASPVHAQNIDFGDDSSTWARDGECDDPRFEGPGMTQTPLLDEDIARDASDCRKAFEAGRIQLRQITSDVIFDGINFGNDEGQWSNDGECDDPRFQGPGMTATILLDEDIRADATDCLTAYQSGRLSLRDTAPDLIIDTINFGNDSSQWSNDGECDDPRFVGPTMTTTPLLSTDRMADASDCAAGYRAGQLQLVGVSPKGQIDFGNDSSDWANDGECDDMRFQGPGMTMTPLLAADMMADATDCEAAFQSGSLELFGQ